MGKSAILITGASKGIGNAAALCLAEQNESASFITGQTIFVDGGASIGRAPF